MNSPEKPEERKPSESPDDTQRTLCANGPQKISSLICDYMHDVETAIKLRLTPDMLLWDDDSGDDVIELCEALKKHHTLAEGLVKQEPLETEDGDTLDEEMMKDSFRDAFRLIRKHPDAWDALKATSEDETGESVEKISQALKMFHSQMENTIMSSFTSEQKPPSRHTALNNNQILIKETSDQIKKIDAAIDKKMKEIQALEKDIKPFLEEDNNEEKGIVDHSVEEPHVTRMRRKVEQQDMELLRLMFEDRQTESREYEQNEKVEKEDEELLQNFENEMKETQAKMESDGVELKKAEELMMKLKEPFELLEKEYDKIIERQRLAEEKARKEEEELVANTKASIIIQAWWRGYCTRKALKSQTKEKKPKKGKGKKK